MFAARCYPLISFSGPQDDQNFLGDASDSHRIITRTKKHLNLTGPRGNPISQQLRRLSIQSDGVRALKPRPRHQVASAARSSRFLSLGRTLTSRLFRKHLPSTCLWQVAAYRTYLLFLFDPPMLVYLPPAPTAKINGCGVEPGAEGASRASRVVCCFCCC